MEDIVSENMQDFIRVMLVANPDKRPKIGEVMGIIEGWQGLEKVSMGEEA